MTDFSTEAFTIRVAYSGNSPEMLAQEFIDAVQESNIPATELFIAVLNAAKQIGDQCEVNCWDLSRQIAADHGSVELFEAFVTAYQDHDTRPSFIEFSKSIPVFLEHAGPTEQEGPVFFKTLFRLVTVFASEGSEEEIAEMMMAYHEYVESALRSQLGNTSGLDKELMSKMHAVEEAVYPSEAERRSMSRRVYPLHFQALPEEFQGRTVPGIYLLPPAQLVKLRDEFPAGDDERLRRIFDNAHSMLDVFDALEASEKQEAALIFSAKAQFFMPDAFTIDQTAEFLKKTITYGLTRMFVASGDDAVIMGILGLNPTYHPEVHIAAAHELLESRGLEQTQELFASVDSLQASFTIEVLNAAQATLTAA